MLRFVLMLSFLYFSLQQREGSSVSPARSCRDIVMYHEYLRRFSPYQPQLPLPDGAYILSNNGNLYSAFCDMSSGAFTLAMRVDGSKGTFAYESYWTETDTLNEHSFTALDAKYQSYNHVAFNRLRLHMTTDATAAGGSITSNSLVIGASGSSLLSVISSNTYTAFQQSPPIADWLSLASPRAVIQANCHRQGFNVLNLARIGILGNEQNDCNSCDSAIGIGLALTFGSGTSAGVRVRPEQGPYTSGLTPVALRSRASIFVSDTYNCSSFSYCSGHGLCLNDACLCDAGSGYTGSSCNTPICYGIAASSNAVCSSAGACVAPNLCVCNHGTAGVQCEEKNVADSSYGTLSMPAKSCFEILTKYRARNRVARSQMYTLYSGSYTNTYSVFCDMETNGGGWTLLMKTTPRSSIFQFDAALWTNQLLLNENSGLTDVDAKFASYNTVAFTEIMLQARNDLSAYGQGMQFNAMIRQITAPSMYALMSENIERSFTNEGNRTQWQNLLSRFSSLHQSCGREVINYRQIFKYDGNDKQKVRLGFIASDAHCGNPKSVIGLGFSLPWNGIYHGNTMLCDCNSNNGFRTIPSSFFVFARENYNCSSRSFCSGHGVCSNDDVCTCDNDFYGVDCSIKKDWGSSSHPASSCSHILSYNSTKISGVYSISLPGVGIVRMFCDFPTRFGLIESFTRAINLLGATTVNNPRNENNPNFVEYRLPFAQMSAINSISQEFAATCNGNTSLVNDYLLASTSILDFFRTGAALCGRVKSVAIRGYRGMNVNIKYWNIDQEHFHIDEVQDCSTPFVYQGQGISEDFFGMYRQINTQFTCVTTAESTTNYWMRTLCSNDFCLNKGTCTNELCVCRSGYSGANCSIYTCFGKSPNDATVCNGYGSCVAPDTCECINGSMGDSCTLGSSCFNISYLSPSICSGNGICMADRSCNCFRGYFGQSCSTVLCNNIAATNASVCSGHGTCIAVDSCQCQNGYHGQFCQLTTCSGIGSTQENVCSGHGACVAFNNCSCSSGYTGDTCNIPFCFGYIGTSAEVCSFRNGTCISPNTCACTIGYFGDICQNTTCYGVNHLSNMTCSGRGKCVKLDTCECQRGYTGQTCQIAICHNMTSDSQSVCSNRNGTCVAADMCNCNEGYTGLRCEIPLCFNVSALNASVCNFMNGSCVANNTCKCSQGYTGKNCEIPACNGISADSSAVCNRNGTCISLDRCVCNSNYTGNNCHIPICWNASAADSTVCSGHGVCLAPNLCNCSSNYIGLRCNIALCFGIAQTNNSVCSNHGTCSDANNCSCHNSWTDSRCETPLCFGIVSTNSSVCNGHGRCTFANICICSAGYGGPACEYISLTSASYTILYSIMNRNEVLTNEALFSSSIANITSVSLVNNEGEFRITPTSFIIPLGRDLNVSGTPLCFGFISGELLNSTQCKLHNLTNNTVFCECKLNVRRVTYGYLFSHIPVLFLSASSNKLTAFASIYNPTANTSIICSALLHPQSYNLLGRPSNCSYINQTLSIEGLFSALNESVTINYNRRYGFINSVEYAAVMIKSQQAPPIIDLQQTTCNLFYFDASLTSSIDKVALRFSWSINPLDSATLSQSILSQRTRSFLNIGSESINVNTTYNVTLIVSTPHGVFSTLSIKARLGQSDSPAILLSTSPIVSAFRSQSVQLSVDLCYTGSSPLRLAWTQVSGPLIMLPQSNRSQLIIPAASFPQTNTSYIFSIAAITNEYVVRRNITVIIGMQNPIAILQGGGRTFSSSVASIILNASQSVDPDMFINTCIYSWNANSTNTNNILFTPKVTNSAVLNVTGPFALGQYTISVQLNCQGRLSNIVYVNIEFVNGSPPDVELRSNGPIISVQSRLTLSSTVEQIVNNPNYTYSWSMLINGEYQRIQSDFFVTPENSGIVRFRSNIFNEISEYRFRVDVVSLDNLRRGFAETIVTTSRTPVILDYNVIPENGTTISTTYVLTCRKWDSSSNMRFYFGYLNLDGSMNYVSTALAINSFATTLPVGIFPNNVMQTFVLAEDFFGGFSVFYKNVTVMPLTFSSQSDLLNFASSATSNLNNLIQRDPGQALQLASNIASLVNTGISTDCTSHQCNGHGTCRGVCACFEGYFGDDCTKSREQLAKAQELRSELSRNIIQASSMQQLSDGSVFVVSQALSQVTKSPTELESSTQSSVLRYFNWTTSTVSARKISLDDDTVSSMLGAVGNVATANLNPQSASNSSSQLITSVISATSQIISQNLVVDELPSVISNKFVSLSVAVASPNATANREISTNGTSLQLNNSVSANEPMRISFISYSLNPYVFSSASQNMTSSVIDFKLQGAQSGTQYSKLKNPIIFVFTGNFDPIIYNFNESQPGLRPSCQYWDEKNQTWSKEGCTVRNVTATTLTCACDHLTSFSSFVKFEMPKLNILSIDDLKLIANLNTDNMTTAIMVGCIVGVYLVLLIIGTIVKTFCYFTKPMKQEMEEIKLSARPFKFYLERLKSSMLWFSILFPPPNKYSQYGRLQRMTVYTISILGIFTANAVLYGSAQGVPINDFLTGFVASLCSTIIITILSTGFSMCKKLSPYNKQKSDSDTKTKKTPAYYLSSTYKLRDKISEVSTKCVLFVDAIIVSTMLKLDQLQRRLSSSKLTITKILLVIGMLIFMAVGISVFLYIMHTYYSFIWEFYYSLIIICLSPSVAFIIPAIISYQTQKMRYTLTGVWPNQQVLVFALVMVVVTLLNGMGVTGLCFYFEFLFRRKDLYVFLIVLLGFVALIACCVFAIFLHIKPPAKAQTAAEPSFLLPWWFVYFWYPVNWAVIGVLSYVLIIYGIKFTQDQVRKWLTSTALGIAYSVLLDPFKTTISILAVGTIQFAFFGILTQEQ